jgi:cellulose synthase operon protein C
MDLRFRHAPALLLLGMAALSVTQAARSAPAAAVKRNGDAAESFAKARQFFEIRDWRSARVELLNTVKADARWAEPRLALAETALYLFDPVLATEQLEKAEALGADRRRFAHLLAHAQWMSGDPAAAIATLRREPVAAQYQPYAYRVLGRAQMDLGDTIAASQSFDEGLALASEDSMLWTEIGRLRIVTANQAAAIEALDRAVALDPNNVRALELRGRLVRGQFGMLAALPWLERGLAVDPNDVPLLEEYGVTLGEAGRYRDMLAQARRILQLDTRNPRAMYMQAVIAARAKNFGLARRLLEKVGGSFGELPGPQLLKAVCEYELGNSNRAVETLARLSSAQPANETVRLALARALHRSGDQDGALRAVAPLSDRADSGTYPQGLAGRILEARGNVGDAAVHFDRAAYPASTIGQVALQFPAPAGASENTRIVIPQIRTSLVQGQTAEARAAADRLLAGNEGVADAQLVMGDVELLAGSAPAAIAAYQRARALNFSRAVLVRLVAAHRANGNDAAASEAIAAFAAYNPADIVALRMLAFDLMDRGEWAQALPLLLRVRLRIGMNDSALNANIARTLSELGRHDEAVRMARLAYRIDRASLMTTRAYGNALVKAKRDPANARALLRKAAKLAPSDENIAEEYRLAQTMKD